MTEPQRPDLPYSGPPPPAPAPIGSRLGARILRRPEPRAGVSLAALGMVLVVLGVIIWADDYASSGGGGRKALGIALSLLVVAAGYAMALIRRTGPLSNAGVTASALGVPVFLAFASYDNGSVSTNAIAIVSIIVWVVSYAAVPGVRGHVFYVAAAALTLWIFLLDKIEPAFPSAAAVLPGETESTIFGSPNTDSSLPSSPDLATVAGVCLVFGVAYYLTALALDRSGRSGLGVAFTVAGFVATVFGLIVAAVELPLSGAGVLIMLLSAALALAGAITRRRFTTWAWTAGVGVGIVVILGDITPDNATAAGISFIVIGAVLVALAPLCRALLRELEETEPTAR